MNNFDLVTLTVWEPRTRERLRLHLVGDQTFTGGDARWQEVERPRKHTAVEWVGTDLHRMTLPLLFDGADANTSVEGLCNTLARWQRPDRRTDRPPLLKAAGPIRQPSYGCLWVIDKLVWAPECIRKADGRRVQQACELTLLEYKAGEVTLGPAARARAGL